MKYTLNFLLKLERDDSFIVYEQESFAESPIMISVPSVVKILEHFMEKFETVGIVDKSKIKVESNSKDISANNEQNTSTLGVAIQPHSLVGLSGEAYICESKKIDKDILSQFCNELTKYLHECCSHISTESFLSTEVSLDISGLREILEVRNYLAKYVNSNKKSYQNGYIYIMVL